MFRQTYRIPLLVHLNLQFISSKLAHLLAVDYLVRPLLVYFVEPGNIEKKSKPDEDAIVFKLYK